MFNAGIDALLAGPAIHRAQQTGSSEWDSGIHDLISTSCFNLQTRTVTFGIAQVVAHKQ